MASIAALTSDSSCITEMVDAFRRRRDLVVELMKDIKGLKNNVPQGAFYLFPEASYYFGKTDGERTIENAMDLCMYILEKGHVATVPGDAFGSPNYIRFSYATSDDQLREALKRMKKVLDELN